MFIRIRTQPAALLLGAGSLILATAAEAQTVRYVASTGSNSANCTRAAPCRGLNRAINVSTDGGEVQILDSGTFGASVQIKKSITISAVGVAATVGGIVIDAPGAIVALRGLLVLGKTAGPGAIGISVTEAAAVQITDCVVERIGPPGEGDGIVVAAAGVDVLISRTISRDNGDFGLLQNTGALGSRIVIDDSHFVGNGGDGIRALGGAAAAVTIERSVISYNGNNGLRVDNGTTARISSSVFIDNILTGVENAGAIVLSRRNNTVDGNTPETSGTITTLGGI